MMFLVVAFVIYFDAVVPAYIALQASKGNEIAEQNLLANEQTVVTQINNLIATYQSQSSDVTAVNAALPVGPHLADALAQLYGIAQANGMSLQSVGISEQLAGTAAAADGSTASVADEASSGQVVSPVGSIAFSLSLAGSYENFENFIVALENNMRFFDIGNISLSGQGGSGATGKSTGTNDFFTFDITATTYYQSQ